MFDNINKDDENEVKGLWINFNKINDVGEVEEEKDLYYVTLFFDEPNSLFQEVCIYHDSVIDAINFREHILDLLSKK